MAAVESLSNRGTGALTPLLWQIQSYTTNKYTTNKYTSNTKETPLLWQAAPCNEQIHKKLFHKKQIHNVHFSDKCSLAQQTNTGLALG